MKQLKLLKAKTYLRIFERFLFVLKIYNNFEDIDSYPVFLKPIYGAGGKGTYLIKNQEELFNFYNEDYNNEFVFNGIFAGKRIYSGLFYR